MNPLAKALLGIRRRSLQRGAELSGPAAGVASLRPDGSGAPSIGQRLTDLRPRLAPAALAAATYLALALASAAPSARAATDPCPNAELRTGPSAQLPDCRAYELVTPSNAGNALPRGPDDFFQNFAPVIATASGDSVIFGTVNGPLPGFDASGINDLYRSMRASDGWTTTAAGPAGSQSQNPGFVGISPDHLYSYWGIPSVGFDNGSLALAGQSWFRDPAGNFTLTGAGELADDLDAKARWLSAGASHGIFDADTKLLADAPATGTNAIYDRTPAGLNTVSLLPGGITPVGGQAATFQGASADGTAIAFKTGGFGFVSNPLSVRLDNATTIGVPDILAGETLTCTAGPGTATLGYQWLRNGTPIAGETNPTYTVVSPDDDGALIQCEVGATVADEGASLRTSSPVVVEPYPGVQPPLPPANILAPTPFNAVAGTTLTCNTPAWIGDPDLSFQWLRNGIPVGGETADTYDVQAADKGTAIQCRITGTTAGGTAVALSQYRLVQAQPPAVSAGTFPTTYPAVANLTDPANPPATGDQLACSDGTWDNGPTFSYEWLRNAAPIAGETNDTYTVVSPDDDGMALQCRVTATTADATAQAVSPRVVADPQPGTNPPTQSTLGGVTGTPVVGNNLTCNTGSWTGAPSFARQWLRNGAPIAGATNTTYTLVAADRETTIQCQLTATNAGGSVVGVNANGGSPAGARYVNPNPPQATSSVPIPAIAFAGLSQGGDRLFYQRAGDVYSLDTATQQITAITDVGDTQLVNISADGSRVYFVSHQQIDGEGTAGQPNFYVTDGSTTTFIAVLAASDVSGTVGGFPFGLGKWLNTVVNPGQIRPGADPSRTTPDGSVIVFESKAQLTAYDNAGHTEVYRYGAADDSLVCVSCNPSGDPATEDGRLQLFHFQAIGVGQASANVSTDGDTVFFETPEALVASDIDGGNDVYRWKDGDISLLSSGNSPSEEFFYAASADGDSAFLLSWERLTPSDGSEFISLYAARVGGGFASETTPPGCEGDACQGDPSGAPSDPSPGSSTFAGPGNPSAASNTCQRLARRARAAQRRARRLRQRAKRASAERARALRRRARRQARKAKRLRNQARRCRGGTL